jgi:hypothetical protein
MAARANETMRRPVVCQALLPYVCQAEATGLLRLGDEIVCVNGLRFEGHSHDTIVQFMIQGACARGRWGCAC